MIVGLAFGVWFIGESKLLDKTESSKPPTRTTTAQTEHKPVTLSPVEDNPHINYFAPYEEQLKPQETAKNREPHYLATYQNTVEIKIKWESYYRRGEAAMTLQCDDGMYKYYSSLGRYYYPQEYINYINDGNNRDLIKNIAKGLQHYVDKYAGKSSSVLPEAVRFVQSIPYAYDIDTKSEEDYPRYPIETLTDNCGDCEDSSILLAGILRELGYEVCLLFYPNHAAVGVIDNSGYYKAAIEYGGKKYVYIETTSVGHYIGEVPADYANLTPNVIQIGK